VKASARAQKMKETAKRDKDPQNMSLYDEHQENVQEAKERNKRLKVKRKQLDDGSKLFADERVQFSRERVEKEGGKKKAKGEDEEDRDPVGWRGYDAKKAALIARSKGPKGHHKFKSKSKHKRR
jgi:hypothetical protein